MKDEEILRYSFWNSIRGHMHWHVVLTHFPISFFTVSAGFMMFHRVTFNECYEIAAFLCLVAGMLMLIPTTLTGWSTWKSKYNGAYAKIFKYKITISYALIILSGILIGVRSALMPMSHTLWHVIFSAGFVLLFIGAMTEGFYGGQLNHRK